MAKNLSISASSVAAVLLLGVFFYLFYRTQSEAFAGQSGQACPLVGRNPPKNYKTIVYDCPTLDRTGGDFLQKCNLTLQGCSDACISDPNCKSFSYFTYDPMNYCTNNKPTCFLKDTIPPLSTVYAHILDSNPIQSGVKLSSCQELNREWAKANQEFNRLFTQANQTLVDLNTLPCTTPKYTPLIKTASIHA